MASQVLHEYWMTLRDRVSAIDELGMATERLRVRLPDEPKPKVLHIIEPHEVGKTGPLLHFLWIFFCTPACVFIGFIWVQVEQNRVKLLNDRAVAKSQLQKKLGQFLYLTNLEKVTNK